MTWVTDIIAFLPLVLLLLAVAVALLASTDAWRW